jgi:hypothetical protein
MVGYSEAAFGRWSHVRRACSNVSLSASAGQCHFSPDGEAIARGDRRISDEQGCSQRMEGTFLDWNDLAPAIVTNEFCRALVVLARRKLARNQMFTARYVPNMYLFGTFSAQNPTQNRAIATAIPHARRGAGGVGKWLPQLRAQGALAFGGGGKSPPCRLRRHCGRVRRQKRRSVGLSCRNNSPRIDLRPERSHSSDVTGP